MVHRRAGVAPLGWHIHIYAEGDKLAEIDDR